MFHEVVDGEVLAVQAHVGEQVELMSVVFQYSLILLQEIGLFLATLENYHKLVKSNRYIFVAT